MLCADSMIENVAEILPALSSSQVKNIVYDWENAYGGASNSRFEESVTGAFPFSWHISTTLQPILDKHGIFVSRSEFHQLLQAWGDLTPWTNTQATMEKILANNISIAVLSNGDYKTLSNAVTYFPDSVHFSHIFGSDFPAGVFKPQHDIYDQAKTVGYDISEILHVAGGSTDASGARDAGLFSALAHSTSFQHRALSSTGDVDGTTPCFTLDDISKVTEILGLGPL
jgi:HAD superfamily hydrolase (TIGR01493 family)